MPHTQNHFFEEVFLEFEKVWLAAFLFGFFFLLFIFKFISAPSIFWARHFCVAAGADASLSPSAWLAESHRRKFLSDFQHIFLSI